ncbi:MAG: GNAT family N-acetyltransferase [Candidatus ainarchaeum sp.]|nr:GNAT family N-acetyltransferase [Candidatus ainarchaeum sp.]
MISKIKYRRFKKSDTKEVAKLISETFLEFNSKDGRKEGSKNYFKLYSSKIKSENELYSDFLKSPIFFIAKLENKIVGMIRGNKNKVTNLYVFGKYHSKEIGKKLLLEFEKEAKKKETKFIKIRSSLYAVPFYQSQGYKKTTGIRNFHGLKIWPLIKTFD